jgi:TP901 family phage tail tape measure protein
MADVQTNWILNLAGNLKNGLQDLVTRMKNVTAASQQTDKSFRVLPQSIDMLRERMKRLETGHDAAFRTDHIERYKRMIEQTKTQIDALTGGLSKVDKGTDWASRVASMRHVSDMARDLGQNYMNAVAPGIDFEHGLKELQAITGSSDAMLKQIGNNARNLAKVYGIDATQSVESFKLVLSQLGPSIAQSPEALKLMGRHAASLSKQLDGDVTASVNLLTVAMNQYGVSLDDPMKAQAEMARMMDIMSKAAQDGSAELPQIKEAIEVVGGTAKTSGLSFEQLNAGIQVIDKFASKRGAEGGTMFRNVLNDMSSMAIKSPQILGTLKAYGVDIAKVTDPTVDWITRLKELRKAGGDTNLMLKIFDQYTKDSAVALLANIDSLDGYIEKGKQATGTTDQMAKTIMDDTKEGLARMTAWFKNLGISIFNATGFLTPFVSGGLKAVEVMAQMGSVATGLASVKELKLKKAFGNVIKSMGGFVVKIATGVVPALLALRTITLTTVVPAIVAGAKTIGLAIYSIPIIGWVAAAVAALAALGVYFYNTSEKFRGFMWGLWDAIKEIGSRIWQFLGGIGNIIAGIFTLDIDRIKTGLTQNMSAFAGMGKSVGSAFEKGKQDGVDDFRKENKKQATQTDAEQTEFIYSPDYQTPLPGYMLGGAGDANTPANKSLPRTNLFDKQMKDKGNKGDSGAGDGGSGGAGGLSGAGGGKVQNITMNFNVSQTFRIDENVRTSVDRIKKMVTNVVQDAANDLMIQVS